MGSSVSSHRDKQNNAWAYISSVSAGITVDKYGVIFFVDGTMIRRIDQNGIISTLLGFNDLTSARPLSCDAVMDISQVRGPGLRDAHSHTPGLFLAPQNFNMTTMVAYDRNTGVKNII